MEKTSLQKYWIHKSKNFNLVVEVPYILKLQNGVKINIEVLLKGYGNKNGMLIVSNYSDIQNHIQEITNEGFGFSCMSQPLDKEIYSNDGIEDILNDWGKIQE